ncbi:MAG: glycosyltransferase family 2 protein [Candidatus Omnitrophota bacterium]
MSSISIVVVVKNEVERIKSFLEKHAWANEIVVVDDMSTDGTPEFVRKSKALLIQHRSDGNFNYQREIGATLAKSMWILQMDADEIIPDSTRDEIQLRINNQQEYAGFEIFRLNHLVGKPIKWGGASDYQMKLYQKGKLEYIGDTVEVYKIDGKVGRIDAPVLHFPAESITYLLRKNLYYSEILAEAYIKKHPKTVWKEIRCSLIIRSFKLFYKNYFRKKGYRDGMHGFVWSIIIVIIQQFYWMSVWEKSLKNKSFH